MCLWRGETQGEGRGPRHPTHSCQRAFLKGRMRTKNGEGYPSYRNTSSTTPWDDLQGARPQSPPRWSPQAQNGLRTRRSTGGAGLDPTGECPNVGSTTRNVRATPHAPGTPAGTLARKLPPCTARVSASGKDRPDLRATIGTSSPYNPEGKPPFSTLIPLAVIYLEHRCY